MGGPPVTSRACLTIVLCTGLMIGSACTGPTTHEVAQGVGAGGVRPTAAGASATEAASGGRDPESRSDGSEPVVAYEPYEIAVVTWRLVNWDYRSDGFFAAADRGEIASAVRDWARTTLGVRTDEFVVPITDNEEPGWPGDMADAVCEWVGTRPRDVVIVDLLFSSQRLVDCIAESGALLVEAAPRLVDYSIPAGTDLVLANAPPAEDILDLAMAELDDLVAAAKARVQIGASTVGVLIRPGPVHRELVDAVVAPWAARHGIELDVVEVSWEGAGSAAIKRWNSGAAVAVLALTFVHKEFGDMGAREMRIPVVATSDQLFGLDVAWRAGFCRVTVAADGGAGCSGYRVDVRGVSWQPGLDVRGDPVGADATSCTKSGRGRLSLDRPAVVQILVNMCRAVAAADEAMGGPTAPIAAPRLSMVRADQNCDCLVSDG